MAIELFSNQLLIILAFIGVGIPISLAARFFELKGLQVWLPFSIIIAIGINPIAGFLVAAVIMGVSFAVKPYPPITLAIMLAVLGAMLYALQMFAITRGNFLFIAMMSTIAYLAVIDIALAFVYPDIKTAILFLAFGVPISFILYSQIGWAAIQILQSAPKLF